MVHFRDGGERIGLNHHTMEMNEEMSTFDFFESDTGLLDHTIPVESVKMIQRKHVAGEK
jgi:hypothetical protein